VLGAGGGLAYLNGTRALSSSPSPDDASAQTKQWALVIDIDKCQDESLRQACADACHRAHNVPVIDDIEDEIKWIWSEPYANAFPDSTHARLAPVTLNTPVLVLCNQCAEPGCVQVCPTQATWKRESDGVVMMDMHRCIGCRYCMAACPYGARSFNFRDPRPHIPGGPQNPFPTRAIGVVEKCNFCVERIRDQEARGEEPLPYCVEVANQRVAGAMIFGDANDTESEVFRVLRDERTAVRKPLAGTGPNVFYIV
jgi:molybdopterin-containing oxidoreductase family iron-sulfur binding subunit